MSPGATRILVHHRTLHCSLGPVLLAWSGHGVCAVLPGVATASQRADLQRRLPMAVLAAGTAAPQPAWVPAVIAALDGTADAAELATVPLDLHGSPFQQRVWQALRAIPAGQTRSYAQLAQAIGQPAALRAVGTACGANPAAVLVPCHRVLRGDGSLGGFHWGLDLKRRLLERERQA